MDATVLEVLATVSGLAQGVLVMCNKRTNWIFYVIQMVFLVLFSVQVRLWGDVVLDSIYIIVGVAGYITWGNSGSAPSITKYTGSQRLKWGTLILLMIVAVWLILSRTDNPLPLLDSITSVTSIIATWFMFRRKLEAWIVWFVNDLFYILEYFMLPDKAVYLMALYVIWTLLAVASYLTWRKLYKKKDRLSFEISKK